MSETKENVKNSIFNSLQSVKKHTSPAQKKKLLMLSVLVLFSAIFDVVGLAAVLPLIKAGTDSTIIHSNYYLSQVYEYFGFQNDSNFVLLLIAILLAYFLFKTAFGIFVNWLQARITADVAVHITRNQFNKYYQLDYLDFNSIKSSIMIRNILYNPTSYTQWIIQPLMMMMSESFIVLLIVGAIAYYDLFLLGFILVTIGPATYMVYRTLRKRSIRIGQGIDDVFPYALSSLTEAITGYVDIKLAGKEDYYRKRYLRHLKSYQELQQSAYLLGMIPLRTNEIIALLGIILIFLYALFIASGKTDVLIMVGAFAAAAYRLMPSMNRILNSMMYINHNQVSIHNLDVYADLVKNESSAIEERPVTFNRDIVFDNVSFSFPNGGKQLFNEIHFEVKKGEKVGFVGTSGSGKTTIMNILLRFYKEDRGNILVDGVPLKNEHKAAWRKIIGYVKQDIFLIDGTIRENITLGDPDYDRERLMSAIKQSSLDQLVNSLPEGIESEIGEKGSNLSGGQRQRIGIARSLYRNAEILIFDEATSALDNKTENEVTESIEALSETNKTIFIIAHRITTLRNCDRIYELKNGVIAGVYNYKDLLAKVI